MISVRAVSDREAWDRLVVRFPEADIRQSWGWGVVRGTAHWSAVRVAVFDGETCVGAVAAYARRLPGFGAVLEAPCGPLLDRTHPRCRAALRALVDALGTTSRGVFVRLSPPFAVGDTRWRAAVERLGLRRVSHQATDWNVPRQTTVLDLTPDESGILARMAPDRRRRLTRAPRPGITIERATSLEALRLFYAILAEHAARQGYLVREWPYFAMLHAQYAPRDDLMVLVGRLDGTPVNAQLNLRFGPMVLALSAPNRPAARGTGLNERLQWELIRWAKAAGCTTIDFGPSASEGIARYKAEIGCRPVLWAPYEDVVYARLRYAAARFAEEVAIPRLRPWLVRGYRALTRLRGAAAPRPAPAPA